MKSEYHTMLSLYVCQMDSKLFYLPYKDWKLVAIIVAEFTRGHKASKRMRNRAFLQRRRRRRQKCQKAIRFITKQQLCTCFTLLDTFLASLARLRRAISRCDVLWGLEHTTTNFSFKRLSLIVRVNVVLNRTHCCC